MAKKDQLQVWNAVRDSKAKAAEAVAVPAQGAAVPEASIVAGINSTSSYAGVMQNGAVAKRVDEIAEPIDRSYQVLIRQLRANHAVGVVVAVNGQILWADIFASTDLLEKYWPKLVRSYAAEAMAQGGTAGKVTEAEAQGFLNRLDGTHETADTDPGVYRQVEITGADYKVFALTSLLPKTDFTVHLAKMYEPEMASKLDRTPMVR
jgi:hypothetical protein